ncbi:hypothetical protein G5B31_02405 [Rhodobacter sp. SGA-6-6]|uniref:hypothetical protein n=1 Tax=Rhodobacter sp. SGA-6-6 TaxID=2710882 RepID=UPI0013EA21AE|nr:hypothetical protein [Rhodobacter sp. SGA-6-6]NGM44384.1 hypothetical protein [Rhodobacter sp. SGA-6-6]
MADCAALETILDRSREALAAGDLAALAGLAAETEAALADAGCCGRALAGRLAEKARRNERLIAAALAGVRAARRRAQDLTDQGRFSTYDAGGRRGQPGLVAATPARRL